MKNIDCKGNYNCNAFEEILELEKVIRNLQEEIIRLQVENTKLTQQLNGHYKGDEDESELA